MNAVKEFRGKKEKRIIFIDKISKITDADKELIVRKYIKMWEARWCLAIRDWLLKIQARLLDPKYELRY
jgi:hypothetical protein